MEKLVSIIVSILIFCLIIVFHEFGHLILAKKNGIMVPEFTLGFGPRLFGFKIGETEYNFRLILIGGACRMLGEDEDVNDERAFGSKSVGARFSTVLAGPVFNFILAFLLSLVIIGVVGYDPCEVLSVEAGGAGEDAGLMPGDIITSFDGHSIYIGRELAIIDRLDGITGETVTIGYERDGKSCETSFTPSSSKRFMLGFYYTADDSPAAITELIRGGVFEKAGLKAGDIICAVDGYAISSGEGLNTYMNENPLTGDEVTISILRGSVSKEITLVPQFTETFELGFVYNYGARVKASPLEVVKYSFIEVRYWIVNTFKSLGMLVTGKLTSNDLGGPVRIVSELENTVEQSKSDGLLYVVLNLMNWAILLSANLGVMNLLPLPALDGGRLMFLLIEAFRHKKIPPEKEGLVHGIGIIILLLLMVFVFFNDIKNVFF